MDLFFLGGEPLYYWHWLTVGVVLVILEVLLPGFFLLWVGSAAIFTGALVWGVGGMALAWQILVFAALMILTILPMRRYRQWLLARTTDQPHLNDRLHGMIGQIYLAQATIAKGHGRAQLGDSWWVITAADDIHQGSSFTVTRVEGNRLHIKPLTNG